MLCYNFTNTSSLIKKQPYLSHFPPVIMLCQCEAEKSGCLWELVKPVLCEQAEYTPGSFGCTGFVSPSKWCISWWSRPAHREAPFLCGVSYLACLFFTQLMSLRLNVMISSRLVVAGLRACSSDCVFKF